MITMMDDVPRPTPKCLCIPLTVSPSMRLYGILWISHICPTWNYHKIISSHTQHCICGSVWRVCSFLEHYIRWRWALYRERTWSYFFIFRGTRITKPTCKNRLLLWYFSQTMAMIITQPLLFSTYFISNSFNIFIWMIFGVIMVENVHYTVGAEGSLSFGFKFYIKQ